MKTHWTREEIVSRLMTAKQPDQELIDLIMYVEKLFYNKHINDIRARQDKLTKLWQDKHRFLAFWNGSDKWMRRGDRIPAMFRGCWSCLFDSISHIRHSETCSQKCDFCYYADKPSNKSLGKGLYIFSGGDMQYTLDETKLLIDRQVSHVSAIGWLQKEPLEELDAIEPIMRYLHALGVHQYMYTNGVKATEDVIDKLADWGLNELRFNLMSTKFSDEVINRMGYAKKKIAMVGIETPIFSRSYKLFVEKRNQILDTGIDQINMPELQIVSPAKLQHFIETEGPVYKHRRGYISPISSRHYVYDLIELAEEESWPVIINDCSNDTKFFRGATSRNSLGYVTYKSEFELPFDLVAYLAEQVLEDGVSYEFF